MDTQPCYARFFVKPAIICGLLLCFIGCKSHKNLVQQVKDGDLSLQLVQLQNDSYADKDYTYKARLIPQKTLLDDKTQADKSALMYQMDSCFYLQSGLQKIYASLVQEIPDGVEGTYEYLLQFESMPGGGKCTFIYRDKYLNHKKYTINLN